MLKSIRFKMVIAFLILGILGVTALGITYISELENLSSTLMQNGNNVEEVMKIFLEDIKITTTIIGLLLGALATIIGFNK